MTHYASPSPTGVPRRMTPEEIVLASTDPMMQVNFLQYEKAHNQVVAKIETAIVDGGTPDPIPEALARTVIIAHESNPTTLGALPKTLLIDMGGGTRSRVETMRQFLIDKGDIKKPKPQPRQMPRRKSKPMANKKGPKVLPVLPTSDAGFKLLSLEDRRGIAEWRDREGREPRYAVAAMKSLNDAGAAARDGSEQRPFPVALFSPVVVNVKDALRNQVRQEHIDSWLIVLLEWDIEMDMCLVSLPDGSDLEYVQFDRSDLSLDTANSNRQVKDALLVAVGNALLQDGDRKLLGKEGKGMTQLFKRYWESQTDIAVYETYLMSQMAFAKNDQQTEGMDRVR